MQKLTIEERQHLTLVSEYIKFHIGAYLGTPPVIVIIAQGLKVDTHPWFVQGLIATILVFAIAGVSAGWFMGRYINVEWTDDRLWQLSKEAYSLRRRLLQHWLYWLGLAIGIGSALAARMAG